MTFRLSIQASKVTTSMFFVDQEETSRRLCWIIWQLRTLNSLYNPLMKAPLGTSFTIILFFGFFLFFTGTAQGACQRIHKLARLRRWKGQHPLLTS